MANNVGEYDELRIKLHLIELRDNNKPLIFNQQKLIITSLKLQEEFKRINPQIKLKSLSDIEVEKLAKDLNAGKAAGCCKADVLINNKGYSIKSFSSHPPAIVNHTPRWGWVRICKKLNIDIAPLDKMVNQYFKLRRAGIIGEDVANSCSFSPFREHKEYLRPLLNYFIFTGTGSRDSKYEADFVLDCKDPFDESTWSIYEKSNYLDLFWDNLVFSMRNKGFESYPYTNSEYKNKECKPWAQKFNDSYKGALHIRVNK